jgi:hypothetical protein
VHPAVDLNHDADLCANRGSRSPNLRHIISVVHSGLDIGVTLDRGQARHLLDPNDLIRYQDVSDSRRGHNFCLAEFAAGHANRTRGYQLVRNRGHFDALDVRSPIDAIASQFASNLRNVPFQPPQVYPQRRSIQVLDSQADFTHMPPLSA